MPPEMTTIPFVTKVLGPIRGDPIYGAEAVFLHKLLQDEGVRTLNPDEADLFFVPLFAAYGATRNIGCAYGQAKFALRYVRDRYSRFWSRRGGRDHFIFVTNDKGGCGLGDAALRPIVLSHWGLMAPFSRMDAHLKFPSYFNKTSQVYGEIASGQWCHSPHKDIVVPPYVAEDKRSRETPNYARDAPLLLVHAGGIWGWHNRGPQRPTGYSLGMRQVLWSQWGGDAGKAHGLLVSNSSIPDAKWSESRFCLAPAGDGWGIRIGKSAKLNCLPLIAQPYVMQPFEDLLNYDNFSVRVEMAEIERLPEILHSFDGQRIAEMRRSLELVRPAFMWDGLAYNYTILALCHRFAQLLHAPQRAEANARCGCPALLLWRARPRGSASRSTRR